MGPNIRLNWPRLNIKSSAIRSVNFRLPGPPVDMVLSSFSHVKEALRNPMIPLAAGADPAGSACPSDPDSAPSVNLSSNSVYERVLAKCMNP